MLFNSIDFAIFLPVIFLLYWFGTFNSIRVQNLLIVFASYFFYGWWDWRFLTLIFFSTFVDYSVGLALDRYSKLTIRRLLLWSSIVTNLGMLAYFKYANFFINSFTEAFSLFGSDIKFVSLSIILPVGISFYTFQTLSYSIDVYRKRLKPTRDFIAFSAFVTFFPQLVAGPIERAVDLLPQFQTQRKFDFGLAIVGLRQILWGLFKKMVIADNCAILVNGIWENYNNFSSVILCLGAVLFSFQIYGDFSGYSDIAIGVARLFGFNLSTNFRFPYFSSSIVDFWKRWHISLTSWFRDYLYFPLGGSRNSDILTVKNIAIVFLVSGLWHGANWTFIVWGCLHAVLFIVFKFSEVSLRSTFIKIILTFTLVTISWVFFRAPSVGDALDYFNGIIHNINPLSLNGTQHLLRQESYFLPVFIVLLLFMEWRNRFNDFGMAFISNNNLLRRVFIYLIAFIWLVFSAQSQEFIYFAF